MEAPYRLGVLTWRKGNEFEEKRFFTDLAEQAVQLHTEIFLFSPTDVRADGRIHALRYRKGEGWRPSIVDPPDLIYDRFRNMQPYAFHPFLKFRKQTKLPFLNSRLAHKWNLHLLLNSYTETAKWLPETLYFTGMKEVEQLLKKYQKVYLKPVNGTGGKGILTIFLNNKGYLLRGRDATRKYIKKEFTTTAPLQAFLHSWVKETKYIVQQGLNLNWIEGSVTDFRLLVQKGSDGNWGITGLIGKLGPKRSATSNLHGGGKAIDPLQFLQQFLPTEKCNELFAECRKIGLVIAHYLENRFGRLVELGIDLGIDRKGRIWIIEVNPKPGRELFREIGDLSTYRKAVRSPIEYALYLKDH
ncbi:MAG TPA: YheC/YheD family protein [Bacillota bacterium]|nr:YheC/YheD family protein [Bacillota bacterium]